jgi:hypothetical protein
MSTPSTLLLCAGAASSLAAVWTLAGFSESSAPRFTPRVVGAAVLGLLGVLSVYGRAPASVRGELSLGMLFALASMAALVVGAAKLEGALAEKDGPRVVRRAAGIVAGTFFGMAAIGAAALDLSHSSLPHARAGWSLMFGLLLGTLVVFAQRGRYAGVAVKALGGRVVVLAVIALALLCAARLTVAAPSRSKATAPSTTAVALVPPPSNIEAPPAPAATDVAGSASAPGVAASVPAAVSAAPDTASAAPAPSAAPVVAAGKPGELQIETITTRGLLEADVRGGVSRRTDRLQACLAEPKNQQSGIITLKVGIDPSGSVTYTRPTGGDLMGTPLAACLLLVFYKMGFAAPASNTANFEITLRAPPP